ncbi:hypothetical protein N9L68_03555 [bacterium]|nr:hypothetical protein [bacterium]
MTLSARRRVISSRMSQAPQRTRASARLPWECLTTAAAAQAWSTIAAAARLGIWRRRFPQGAL